MTRANEAQYAGDAQATSPLATKVRISYTRCLSEKSEYSLTRSYGESAAPYDASMTMSKS